MPKGNQWKAQRRALAPLFSRKAVSIFSQRWLNSAEAMVERLSRHQDRVIDIAVEATRTTLDVLGGSYLSDGFSQIR